jgi:hypothetical protein
MYFNVRLNFKSLILSLLFFTSVNFISAQSYTLGAASGYTTYRATNNSNSGSLQTCDCPSGKVIVGIQGAEGGYVDNFKIICATLNSNGTLSGAAVVNTQIGNSNLGNAYNESFSSPTAMVGANIRTGNELDALTARGNTVANIAASSANTSYTASLSVLGGSGGSSNDDYAPNGNVFVGVRYRSGPYGGGIQFRYAPITSCTPATTPTSISGTQTICSGQSTTLTASGGTVGTGGAFQWYAGGCGSGSVLGTGASVTVSPTTTTTYFVRRTSTCASATSCYSVTVTVNALATAPTSISGSNTLCSGSSVTLTANGGSGSVYEWGTGGTVGSNVISGVTGSTYSPSPTSTTTYWVRRKQTSPCTGNTNGATFTVTVSAPATAPTSISGSNTLCSGSSVTLTANGGTGSVYEWGTGGTVGSNVISGVTGSTYSPSPSTTTTYWVRRKQTSPCSGNTNGVTFTVTVSTPATAPTSISGSNTLCSGSSVTLTANGGTGSVYEWGTGGTVGSNVISGVTGSTYSPSPSTTTTYWVRRKQTSPCSGNTGGVSFTVTVNSTATAPTSIGGVASICPGNSVVLTAIGGSGSLYEWGTGGTVGSNVISGATGETYSDSPTTTTTYWVRRTQQSPCTGATNGVTFTVTVASATSLQYPTIANGDYVWTGIIDEDWSTDANWSIFNSASGTFSIATSDPDLSTLNVFIPSINSCNSAGVSTVRNTRLDRDRTVNNITILTDGLITVDGTDDLDVFGDWINNGSFDHNNQVAKVDFKNITLLQSIGGTSVTEFYELEISENNSNNVVLNNDIIVDQDFTFDSDRKFELGDFTITFTGSASITGESNSRYFVTNGNGFVKRTLNSSTYKEFPVGINTYNPCFLNNTGTADVFSVRVIENVTNNGTGVGPTTAAPVVKRTWMVNELLSGGSVVDMRLYWNGTSDEINSFEVASQFVAHHNGIDWENLGATSNSTAPLFIQKDNISSFSPFTIGSLGGSPLPVELTSFNAVCEEGKGVNVTWTTASEHNSSYFDVLKSDDGQNWRSISTVAAAGNATSIINYGILDAEKANGIAYYKLMQYDIDGESKEYGPISSDCYHLGEMLVKTFPNPSGDEFYVELISPEATSTIITIVDAQGKSVYTRTVETEKGTNLYTFEALNVLPGMYYIQISNDITTPNVVKHSFR